MNTEINNATMTRGKHRLPLTSAQLTLKVLSREESEEQCEVPGCGRRGAIRANFTGRVGNMEVNPLQWFDMSTNRLCGIHLIAKMIEAALVVEPRINFGDKDAGSIRSRTQTRY